MKFSVPYLKLRNGRPRWEPGPALRAAGFTGQDLRDEGGRWLDEGRAVEAARELNRKVTAWREAGAPRRRPQSSGPKRHAQSLAALWALYEKSPYFARLRASTQADYRSKARVFVGRFGNEPAAALTTQHMSLWWQHLYETRTHAIANGVIAVLRLTLTYGSSIGWVQGNACSKLRMVGVEARRVIWTPDEAAAAVAMADYLNTPSVGDAIIVALHSGQRQADVLSLELPETVGGRARFVQAKTGQRVTVPLTPQFEARLAAIAARRVRVPVADPIFGRRVVLREDGTPYDKHSFGKAWRPVRDLVAETMPDFADKLFLDLRDTAITRLAEAGCTMPQIAAISGHKLNTVNQIMEHYLALNDQMADEGIERLTTWMEKGKIAV